MYTYGGRHVYAIYVRTYMYTQRRQILCIVYKVREKDYFQRVAAGQPVCIASSPTTIKNTKHNQTGTVAQTQNIQPGRAKKYDHTGGRTQSLLISYFEIVVRRDAISPCGQWWKRWCVYATAYRERENTRRDHAGGRTQSLLMHYLYRSQTRCHFATRPVCVR